MTARKTTKKAPTEVSKRKKTVVETAAVAGTDMLARVRGAQQTVTVGKAGGRPMLSWVGKRAPASVQAFPAQLVETYGEQAPEGPQWDTWPNGLRRGGLLYHGDNKEVLAHLLANGFRGQVKLIYIDPPFDSGADYVRKVELRGPKGKVKLDGEGYTLGEQIQYTDIWANDNYLQFMYERLLLLKELLSEDGAVYLHCDPTKNSYLRCLLDEVFGSVNFRSEVVWRRTSAHSDSGSFGRVHDTVYFYSKGPTYIWNEPRADYEEWYVERYYRYRDETGRRFKSGDLSAYGLSGGGYEYDWKGRDGLWRCPQDTMKRLDAEGKLYYTENGVPRLKQYLDEMDGQQVQSIWDDVLPLVSWSTETVNYPTQKPESLVERVITASSNPGDLVLDCFIGSGTTAAVAQKLSRRWIGCDINKGAIQTTVKRLQSVMEGQAAEDRKPAQGTLLGVCRTFHYPSAWTASTIGYPRMQ